MPREQPPFMQVNHEALGRLGVGDQPDIQEDRKSHGHRWPHCNGRIGTKLERPKFVRI